MTQLENNTTALEAILATVNALPNAGSGGEADIEEKTYLTLIKTITFTGNGNNEYTYAHNAGVVPLAITITTSGTRTTNQVLLMSVIRTETGTAGTYINTSSSNTSYNYGSVSYTPAKWDENEITMKSNSTTYKFASGKSYTVRIYA